MLQCSPPETLVMNLLHHAACGINIPPRQLQAHRYTHRRQGPYTASMNTRAQQLGQSAAVAASKLASGRQHARTLHPMVSLA